jgi:hypothetical protein
MDTSELRFGFTTCYIRDYPFHHICDIPSEVAIPWISQYIKPSEMQGQQFVIVGGDHGKFVAINYSNYIYSIYLQTGIYSNKKSDKELTKLYEGKIENLLKDSKVLKETLPSSISFNDFNNLPEVKELISELKKEGITKKWLAENGFAVASIIFNM